MARRGAHQVLEQAHAGRRAPPGWIHGYSIPRGWADSLHVEVDAPRGEARPGRMTGADARVLVTGGSGFIGTNLVELYLRTGSEVLSVDSAAPRKGSHAH